MTTCCKFVILGCLVCVLCPAQETTDPRQGAAAGEPPEVPATRLQILSSTDLPSIHELLLSDSVCAVDNSAFVTQLATTEGLGDLVYITNDASKVVRLSTSLITDIWRPSFVSPFLSESDVYVLTTGGDLKSGTHSVRQPDGKSVSQFATRYYIAHFKNDGTYVGAISLDIPFDPMQLGVFAKGEFLIGGATRRTNEPRLAIVKPSGQLERFVELSGDIHSSADGENGKGGGSSPGKKDSATELRDAEASSNIVPDGVNLLLVRIGQKTPVFSISPGGEVRAVTLEVPSGLQLYELKTGPSAWIAVYTRKTSDDPRDPKMEVETYKLDPQTGKIVTRYLSPQPLGFGLACGDGREFAVFTRENDSLQLLRLAPNP